MAAANSVPTEFRSHHASKMVTGIEPISCGCFTTEGGHQGLKNHFSLHYFHKLNDLVKRTNPDPEPLVAFYDF